MLCNSLRRITNYLHCPTAKQELNSYSFHISVRKHINFFDMCIIGVNMLLLANLQYPECIHHCPDCQCLAPLWAMTNIVRCCCGTSVTLLSQGLLT